MAQRRIAPRLRARGAEPEPEPTPPPPPAFGTEIRNQEFALEDGYTFMNMGSRGVTSKPATTAQISEAARVEANNDQYWTYDKPADIDNCTQKLATFLNCQEADLSFVECTSRALNNIIKSVRYSQGDAILQNNFTFFAVKNTTAIVKRDMGVEIIEMEHTLPITSTDQILDQYRAAFAANKNIKLAIVDHVSSRPAIYWPIKDIIQICHDNGALVLIDGAHAVGHVPVDITDIGADFYAGNCYKWLFGPKSCAFQWVSPAQQSTQEPVVTHSDYLDGFPDNMFDQGTRSDAPYLAFPAVSDFHKWIGGLTAVTNYTKALVDQGVGLLEDGWKTSPYPIPLSMRAPFMRNVIVPDTKAYPKTSDGASRLSKDLMDNYKVCASVAVSTPAFGGSPELMMRVSAQIPATLNDFKTLRDAVLELANEEPSNPRQITSRKKILEHRRPECLINAMMV